MKVHTAADGTERETLLETQLSHFGETLRCVFRLRFRRLIYLEVFNLLLQFVFFLSKLERGHAFQIFKLLGKIRDVGKAGPQGDLNCI